MKIFFDTEFQDNGSTIEMISLGAVRDTDNVQFYAEAGWTHLGNSSTWVADNVHPHLRGGSFVLSRYEMAARFRMFCEGATEFWADSPSYDWVAVSQLYGSMLDRPSGWPYNACDLRQFSAHVGVPVDTWPKQDGAEHDALADAIHHQMIWKYLASAEIRHDQQADTNDRSVQVPVDLLNWLVDPDPCWFDHHGGCQAHGFLSLKPGEMCPEEQAKQLSASYDGGKDED